MAVKVDHRPLNEDKERRRFLREAGAAGRLSGHPGIVTVHDAGILSDGRPYLVMDLCTGGSLTQWLKPQGRQDQQRIRDVGVQIADALAAAHARGVLHRDVKPANILIDSFDRPGLADFGLAAIPEPGEDLSVTLEGMTPAYAPKEVFYLKPPTAYGDVYSLAATLYALLDGKPPRWPDTGTPNLPELLELQANPIERLPDLDPEFMDLLLRAMDDDPERRLTAAEFRDQLQALSFAGAEATTGAAASTTASAASTTVAAASPTSAVASESGGRRRSRRPLVALLLVVALIAAVTLGSIPFGGNASSRSATQPAAAPSSSGAAEASPSGDGSPSADIPSAATPSTPSASPSRAPEGFVDCSQQLGGQSYCLTEPECWTDLGNYRDYVSQATMQDCDQPHLYQTYAAGVLRKPVKSQSQLEARPEVQALCIRTNLNNVLMGRTSRKDWQIAELGPQVILEDDLFRCLFAAGGFRTGPVKLKRA